MKMKPLVYFVFLLGCVSGFAQNTELFERGKEFYKNESYQQAIDSWEKITDNGEASANLYFNLGNAYYKLNKIGPGIYYYEKALQLKPGDADITNNLAFAENARIDIIEPLPKSLFNRWYQSVTGLFSMDGWALVNVISVLLFTALFLLYYFAMTESKKRMFFAGAMVALISGIVSLSLAFTLYNTESDKQTAIIFSERIEVKSEPRMGSSTAFVLHEGTKVQITAEDGDWYRIKLADGKDGWAPVAAMKEL